MIYLKQLLIILTITFIGEILNYIIPLPIPASIYGLVLMLFALLKGVIKIEQVENTAKFLIEIMPLMFIPSAVVVIGSWSEVSSILIELILIMAISTVAVMVVAGRVVQKIVEGKGDK